MKTITSIDNPIFRLCVQLGQKKYRDRLGFYIVEGQKTVEEALDFGKARTVVLREDYGGSLDRENPAFVFMTGNLFSRIAQTETSQGILAVVEKAKESRKDFLGRITKDKNSKVLVLDRLQDPGNIGTMIRTADAAGYAGLIVIKGTGDIFSPKVVRAASGSLLRLPVFKAEDAEDALRLLGDADKLIVGTTPEGGMEYTKANWAKGIALVIGNEGNGISDAFKEASDLNVYIPMNQEVDSLNAAVAAGILIYESVRER